VVLQVLAALVLVGPVTDLLTRWRPGGATHIRAMLPGLVFALALMFVFGALHPTADPMNPLTPSASWRRDRLSGLAIGLAAASFSLTTAALEPSPARRIVWAWLFTVGAAVGASGTWAAAVTFAQRRMAGLGPLRMMRFLEDARKRGVLSSSGPYYQFRHALLQDRLAAEATGRDPARTPGRGGRTAGKALGRTTAGNPRGR